MVESALGSIFVSQICILLNTMTKFNKGGWNEEIVNILNLFREKNSAFKILGMKIKHLLYFNDEKITFVLYFLLFDAKNDVVLSFISEPPKPTNFTLRLTNIITLTMILKWRVLIAKFQVLIHKETKMIA